MKLFKRVVIIGVGLIGGSIGLDIKKKKLAREVIGVARRESSRKKALKYKTVDRATLDLKSAVSSADLVIIATPLGSIAKIAHLSAKYMKKGAILSDVGSTKRVIVEKIEKIVKNNIFFVGSHPMAGSDESGPRNASSDLFKGAPLILTRTKKTNPKALNKIRKFWNKLGSRVTLLSPKKHDELVSLVSYLPHAVSCAIVSSQTKDSVKLAAGSFRDTTRVSMSEVTLWKDIFITSASDTLRTLRKFKEKIGELEKALRKKDSKRILSILTKTKYVRKNISHFAANEKA